MFNQRFTFYNNLINEKIYNEKYDCIASKISKKYNETNSLDNENLKIIQFASNNNENRKYKFIKSNQNQINLKLEISRSSQIYKIHMKIIKITIKMLNSTKKNILEYQIWKEQKILDLFTLMVKKYKVQHFPISYGNYICSDKYSDNKKLTFMSESGAALISYNELYELTLGQWSKKTHTEEEWINILFQLWLSIYILKYKLKMVHTNLTLNNIYILKTKKVGHWEYILDDKIYRIPNLGFTLIICNFDSTNSIIFLDRFIVEKNNIYKYDQLVKKYLKGHYDFDKIDFSSPSKFEDSLTKSTKSTKSKTKINSIPKSIKTITEYIKENNATGGVHPLKLITRFCNHYLGRVPSQKKILNRINIDNIPTMKKIEK